MDASFRDYIGFDVDPAEIQPRAQALLSLAEKMAPSHRNQPDAWGVHYDHLKYVISLIITRR